jgi:hypothetical protein
MRSQAAMALAQLAHSSMEKQAAIARTGAIAPLCTLVREGTLIATDDLPGMQVLTTARWAPLVREGSQDVREQSAFALWSLSQDTNPNKVTVAKLGGIEPLVTLMVGGNTDVSLEISTGAC